MGQIKAIITDFDGTLVNTLMANLCAYKEAFKSVGIELNNELYKECYGLRFDDLCKWVGLKDKELCNQVKELKKKIYPSYFEYCVLNDKLLNYIRYCKSIGLKTCIASTAAKTNLYNVLNYFGITGDFDIIISGEDVSHGKPNPEVYNKALTLLDCESDEALVFEDSHVGCKAAEAANISYIKIRNFA